MPQLVASRNLICQSPSVHIGDNFPALVSKRHVYLLWGRQACEHYEVIAGLPSGKIAVRIYGELSDPADNTPRVSLTPVNSYFAPSTHKRDALAFLYRVAIVQRRL